jgi:fused signal recognition particle receptor
MEVMEISLGLVLIAAPFLIYFVSKKYRKAQPPQEKLIEKIPTPQVLEKDFIDQSVEMTEEIPQTLPHVKDQVKDQVPVSISWNDRLKKGLNQSRKNIWGKLELIFSDEKKLINSEQWELLEEILYGADLNPSLVQELLSELQKNSTSGLTINEYKKFLYDFLLRKMRDGIPPKAEELFFVDKKVNSPGPRVIMVVGINGAGKTTTIGKLATKLTAQGAKVVVGACDTFRAAAVDQLEVWCSRANAVMIRAQEGSDPSSVAYKTLEKAQELGSDYCILDTAGRIHTHTNLMEEIKKGKRVLGKLDQSAPHHILLVVDAITGQNALKQAKEFHKALDLTGVIFTKCDGSSKAGNAVSIVDELKIPIVYIGVGEEVGDLNIFNEEEFLKTLLDYEA